MKNLLYTVALAVLTIGCGAKQKNVKTFKDEKIMGTNVPGWALNPKPGCAIGSYKMKGNLSMAMDISYDRSIHQLSRQLKVLTKSLVRNYLEEGEHESKTYSENLAIKVTESVTKLTLNGASPVKQGASDDYYFTLTCLNPKQYADSFDAMEELDDTIRRQLRIRAEKGFEALDEKAK